MIVAFTICLSTSALRNAGRPIENKALA